jgi:hypothetical protein
MGTVTVLDAAGEMIGNVPTIGLNEVIVTLSGVPDAARASIALVNVNNAGVDAAASVGFLTGDVDNTFLVDASDIRSVKARAGQTTTAANFKFDLNASGTINAGDIATVKARFGQALP